MEEQPSNASFQDELIQAGHSSDVNLRTSWGIANAALSARISKIRGGTVKHPSCSAMAVASIVALTATFLGSGANASPESDVGPSGGSLIDAYVQEKGPKFVADQQDLSDFKYWITQIPGIEDAGYVDQVNNAETRSTRLLWKGASPLRAVVLAEAKARGISATVSERQYSLPEIDAAIRKIDARKPAFEALGFHVESIVGVQDDDGAITVEGHALKGRSPDLSLVSEEANRAAGLRTRIKDGVEIDNAVATRSNDTAPFNSGGYNRNVSVGGLCSTGFSLRDAYRTYTTNARHCPQGSWYARDAGTYVGYQLRDSPDGMASLLDGTGSPLMFDGAWNNAAGYYKRVSSFQDVSLGDYVCTSGGNSGVHCNIKVLNLRRWYDDGFGGAYTIEGYQQTSGQIAAIQGDSGGPVLFPKSDGTVGAVGMIQAVPGGTAGNCGSVHDAGANKCSRTVLFTSTRTIANSMNMSLVTTF